MLIQNYRSEHLLEMTMDKRHQTLQLLFEYARRGWVKIESPTISEIEGFLHIIFIGDFETRVEEYYEKDLNYLGITHQQHDMLRKQVKILKLWWREFLRDIFDWIPEDRVGANKSIINDIINRLSEKYYLEEGL